MSRLLFFLVAAHVLEPALGLLVAKEPPRTRSALRTEIPTCQFPTAAVPKGKWCYSNSVSRYANGRKFPRREKFLIATYGPNSSNAESDSFCSERKYADFRDFKQLGLPVDLRSADGLSDPVFLNVGGNIFTWEFSFANNGYTVVSVDPKPSSQALFKASACMEEDLAYRMKFVNAFLDVSDNKDKECQMCHRCVMCKESKSATGAPACRKDLQNSDDHCTEDVPVMSLDQVVEQHATKGVDVLKIDTDGYELKVLQGAKNLLSKVRPRYIVVRFHQSHADGATPLDLADTLRLANYKMLEKSFNGNEVVGAPQITDVGWDDEAQLFYFVRKD